MSDYMAKKIDGQIEAGIKEREFLINENIRLDEENNRLKEVLKKYAEAFEHLELLARNISDQCTSWEDLSSNTPAQLTNEQKEYIDSVYIAYELIEKNEAKHILVDIENQIKR